MKRKSSSFRSDFVSYCADVLDACKTGRARERGQPNATTIRVELFSANVSIIIGLN